MMKEKCGCLEKVVLAENGFPVGLPNEIAEYMKQHGEPPTVPKIIIKKNEP